MRNDRKEVIKLRSSGKSYSEISEELGIPKSTLSVWFQSQEWSREIKRKLSEGVQRLNSVRLKDVTRIRGENLKRLYEEARSDAAREFNELKYHPLFLSGVLLYWGEGDKVNKHQLRISNSDPKMIKVFVDFLKMISGDAISRMWLNLVIYPDLVSGECINYWSQQIGINGARFNKCVVIKGRHKTRKLSYGTCCVGISSRFLKEKMLVWLTLLPEELIKYLPEEEADMV